MSLGTMDYMKVGKGGYCYTNYSVSSSTTVYVGVGGKGNGPTSETATSANISGGYNGGGNGTISTYSGYTYDISGGGATHFALENSLLRNISNVSTIIIVAGAGGGAAFGNAAGAGVSYYGVYCRWRWR